MSLLMIYVSFLILKLEEGDEYLNNPENMSKIDSVKMQGMNEIYN